MIRMRHRVNVVRRNISFLISITFSFMLLVSMRVVIHSVSMIRSVLIESIEIRGDIECGMLIGLNNFNDDITISTGSNKIAAVQDFMAIRDRIVNVRDIMRLRVEVVVCIYSRQ